MANNANIIDRILFYWSKLYIREIKIGENYKELEKAIVILLSNEKITDLKEQKYHTKWQIIETENRKKILTDKLEIHIIEIEKIKENQEKENEELITWLNFLENPESEEVKEKMENNKTLKKAKEKLSQMSEDEYMQRIAEWREKAILDENTNKKDAYENGVKDGIEQGRAQGMAQGIEQGIAQGNKMAKVELVKNMLKENITIETISKISKLSKEEIEKIKNNTKN